MFGEIHIIWKIKFFDTKVQRISADFSPFSVILFVNTKFISDVINQLAD